MGQQKRSAIAMDFVIDIDPVSIDFRHSPLSQTRPLLISFYRDLFTAVNCSTFQETGCLAPMRGCIGHADASLLPQRQHTISEIYSRREISKLHCLYAGNPIILAAKAGIDPVGASYPKVSCPP